MAKLAKMTLGALLLGCLTTPAMSQVYYNWMSPEIKNAWTQGYRGQGTTITVVDDFSSRNGFSGNLGDGTRVLRHGDWTFKEIYMLAPYASMKKDEFTQAQTVRLYAGLNILNLSYGMFASSQYSLNQLAWSSQESSIIQYARNGAAVVVKAAGNYSVAVTAANAQGQKDFLNLALVGAQSALFVGALDRNGTTTNKANIASYSNYAGADASVQQRFLMVGVRGDLTGLYGTSFAAPVISAYSSVLGSKFKQATATQISNQLLNTARQDTIMNYNVAIHGRGEASITRALAPVSIR